MKARAETNENNVFKFDYAEPNPILFKDNANRTQNNNSFFCTNRRIRIFTALYNVYECVFAFYSLNIV